MTSYGWSTRSLFVGCWQRVELPSLVDAISDGAIAVKANTVPLADVEEAWTREEAPGERTVLVP